MSCKYVQKNKYIQCLQNKLILHRIWAKRDTGGSNDRLFVIEKYIESATYTITDREIRTSQTGKCVTDFG